jgi:spermidine synthase
MSLSRTQMAVLLASLLILSACAILYELLISTVSAYLLGSSVLHFSVTIGLFLSFLGVGAYLSKFLDEPLLPKFIRIELLLGLAGGCSALVLYLGNAWFPNYYALLFLCVGVIAILAGMEIPLVTRLLEHGAGGLREVIARVLTFDYLGALVASLAFPLLLLPMLGSMRTAFFTGLINWAVGVFNLRVFRQNLPDTRGLWMLAAGTGLVLTAGFVWSFQLLSFADALNFQDRVVLTQQTPYQRIVVTRWNQDTRLYLNGNLQFCSVDEYRYHEALIHVPLLAAHRCDSVLILGGGDGLALREVWKNPGVRGVDLVDLDAEMLRLCRNTPLFTALNQHSMDDARLRTFSEDAFGYVKRCSKKYNVIIVDLPDPSDVALCKLYSVEFYQMLRQVLAADGVLVTQSTSPFLARKPFWCIHTTLESVFPGAVMPYHAYVPSFGLWGYNMALARPQDPQEVVARIRRGVAASQPLRYLNADNLPAAFVFDNDVSELPQRPNTLERQELLQLYSNSFWDFH